tara:strand:- start:1369 stop:1545 length:177 start_codon:yes stop_codon:yes gene_type:complete
MKVKLKKGEKLSSNYNFCNLPYDSWVSLNQGKTIELEVIPNEIKEQINIESNSKKGEK